MIDRQTTLLIMAEGIVSQFGDGIKQLESVGEADFRGGAHRQSCGRHLQNN